ncbi:MAG: hypothetical protein E7614_04090 [Ruminococcaceae bacterium]|nr:hypothetical protein [Oscillospiraceae bacterium]
MHRGKYTYKYKNGEGGKLGKYRIEILSEGGKDVLNVEGCKSIEKYTVEEIKLELNRRKLTVFGKGLNMPVLVGGNLCIKGFVKSLEFSDEAEKRKTK